MDLNQVTIPSKDLSKAVPFYQKLGLKLIVDASPDYVRFESPTGRSTFSIQRVQQLPQGNGVVVYFECENLDQKVEELKNAGFIFDHDSIDQPWLWREAALKDLDGNNLIIYYAGENRLNPPWRIS